MVTVLGGKSKRLCPDPNAFRLSSKGQTRAKAGDAKPWAFGVVPVAARLPKGWAGEEPVRPRMPPPLPQGALVPIRGLALANYATACPAFLSEPTGPYPWVFCFVSRVTTGGLESTCSARKKIRASWWKPGSPSILTGPVHPFGSLAALSIPPSGWLRAHSFASPPHGGFAFVEDGQVLFLSRTNHPVTPEV